MSRHHIVFAVAAALWVWSWLAGSVAMAVGVAIGLVAVLGVGVAIPQCRMFGPFVCRGSRERKCVALTFDDGPDARSTPALLDLLREAQLEVAFFCVGKRVTANPELAARIVREGHLLENHSYGHSNATNFFSTGRLQDELARAQDVIIEATGITPRRYRPPIGLSNPRVFRAARTLGLTVVGWTAGGLDTMLTEPERIVARISRRLKPGTIVLLHDGNIPADRLVRTVKLLLDRLRALGYEVVRLDRILT